MRGKKKKINSEEKIQWTRVWKSEHKFLCHEHTKPSHILATLQKKHCYDLSQLLLLLQSLSYTLFRSKYSTIIT